ncbi:MAG: hypothetical protein Kow00124_17010 [Anaerolineae bacterium]
MGENKDRVLLVSHDADERATLTEAALEPFGYQVQTTGDGNEALSLILASKPDVVILDLEPEGLSGTDVIAALNAQAVDVPVIVLANEGEEREALTAFRLGAKDYIVRPVREAELIQVVERALKEVRIRREREVLVGEVRQAAQEAEARLREIKTLIGIGKTVSALTTLNQVFDHVIRAAIQLTRAESVGIFLRDESTGNLVLRAGRNLNRELMDQIGRPVKDDLAAMVMNSRQTFISGSEGLRRFKPAQEDASAVIYAPLVAHDAPIGLLWVANSRLPFEPHMGDLMTALADYAAIALVNAHLFATMQERTRQLERLNHQLQAQMQASASGTDTVPRLASRIRDTMRPLLNNLAMFRNGEMGELSMAQKASVDVISRQMDELIGYLNTLIPTE